MCPLPSDDAITTAAAVLNAGLEVKRTGFWKSCHCLVVRKIILTSRCLDHRVVRGECYHSLMRNAKALLRLCEGEQISLIDGYKMLRTELEAQQAKALEWNGVHS